MHYESVYRAYKSRIDPNRLFESEAAAKAYDVVAAECAIVSAVPREWGAIIKAPSRGSALARSVQFLAEMIADSAYFEEVGSAAMETERKEDL